MEWVETTAKTLEEAKSTALDRLGVGADEAEFDVVEEPRPGLFGRMRGEARVRARVKPAQVRPKQDRRRRSKSTTKSKRGAEREGSETEQTDEPATGAAATEPAPEQDAGATEQRSNQQPSEDSSDESGRATARTPARSRRRTSGAADEQQTSDQTDQQTSETSSKKENTVSETQESPVTPQEVGDAAVAFMDGLAEAFGASASTELSIDGTELDVAVTGEELGLLVGPGGRTLNAIQDLTRVAAQRRLGDHETRLRVDVAGYRERRREALTRFAQDVAAKVRESGVARSLEPMSSADRKVIHDVLNEEDGVSSRSEGDDPDRRVVVVPG